MAEIIVNFVVRKLTDVAVKEVLQLFRVDEQVKTVSRELGWIQPFLKDADKKQITDESQKHWVDEVRDVAYLIEDAIDTFLSEVPPEPQKFDGMIKAIKRLTTKIKKIPAVHKLVYEISKIQKKMKEIDASRLRYGINALGENNGEIKLPIRSPVLPNIDPDVVGFKEDQDHVVKELLDETTKKRSVISIWGVGGLGKTTLAQKVYNRYDVKAKFEICIWVAISQNFKLIDILREIAEQLNLRIDPNTISKEHILLAVLHESLISTKYLIVLDDVWTKDLWTQIGKGLPDEKKGSRVLITTRFFNVAKNADPTCEPYKLGFLTNELSSELFLKKALPNHDANESPFDDFDDISDQLIRKCGKLPLALEVLGGLLSEKPCNSKAWLKVLKMSWHDGDLEKCSEIIGTSYEGLSFVLKSCFMYFAAFPENYDINAKSLLRMWIAEGFIPKDDNRTLEETAESYLEDLVQRSLVQVKSRSSDSIKDCCIHVLLRDLAIQKAKENNFFVLYHPDNKESLKRARRVAVHPPSCNELVMSQNLRTLLCFHNEGMPDCSEQKLLRVVSTEARMDTIELGMFKGLTQTRYLNLIGKLSDKSIGGDQRYGERNLEKLIGTMRCIQTLNLSLTVRKGNADNFPDCAWHIKTLRHVTTQFCPELPSSTELPDLQTLAMVNTNESWKTELFDVRMVVVAFLGTLKHLISLNLPGFFPGDGFDMRIFPFYQQLKSLELSANNNPETPNEMVIDVSMLPPHLIDLRINYCHFRQDVMSVLENLHCLKILILHGVKTNPRMRCSARGFNQLEVLKLIDVISLEDWEIEMRAMPILRELWIKGCDRLCVPQGLRHLTNLQKLFWFDDKGHWGKEDEVRNLCKDVPSLELHFY
jgi:hypothetical protein